MRQEEFDPYSNNLLFVILFLFGILLAVALLIGSRDHFLQTKTLEPVLVSENDDCKVYRFLDAGSYHYFTKCGDKTTTEKEYKVGKHMYKTESITNEIAK